MKDMAEAVERIEQAIRRGESILFYGDYDVDGTTAVALMYSFSARGTQKLDTTFPIGTMRDMESRSKVSILPLRMATR